jgi:glycosyltransferase involved in cell wall biosynthesis
MLAPEPFFEPRGTPFSEYHRIKALGELGYEVDLVTYPIGRDVDLPNLRIIRGWRPPLIRDVPIGPSFTKIVLDVGLAARALQCIRAGAYDAVHSHEEAGLLGLWLARKAGIPHLYDMHSSLPQQLSNFRYTRSAFIRKLFERAEGKMIAESTVVITICQELQDAVVAAGAGDRAFLIENVMGGEVDARSAAGATSGEIRSRYGIGASEPLLLYTGTFEEYQGLGLLVEVAARLSVSHPTARVLVVGGEPAQVSRVKERADVVASNMIFTGQQPPGDMPTFVEAADILVSPRVRGTNTPLKIYSYLRSGRPIVATNLRTHTQVLDQSTAALVPPEAEPFAAAVGRLIDQPAERHRLAEAARSLAAERYGRESYLAKTAAAYAQLLPGAKAGGEVSSSQKLPRSKVS